ncbi:YciI family protein [Amaricoccus sp.]|uniref:YciI family protein n=1 Tax=Amaricoccus sp. TaxID=1872485 RepID=UPI001B492F11|nr:YciI family protein [Amaricoccus sp.]MBP7000050.1 YciI family protein [Amaricoccus sp.]
MPLYALICDDKPGGQEIRAANRAAHLDYLRDTGVVVLAGPFQDDAGGMTGSLLVLDVADRAAAEAWAAADPYARAGLFASVAIRPWKKVVG